MASPYNKNLIDGASAVWNKDPVLLRAALEEGWDLPFVRFKHGQTEDLTLILRVIASSWLEGWKIWCEYRPDFAEHMILIDACISQAEHEILQDIIERNEGLLPWDPEKGALSPAHFLFQLIGNPLGFLVPEERIVSTLLLLGKAGVDLHAPYPKSDDPDSVNPSGFTLWTWSLMWGAWKVAEGLNVGDDAFLMEHWRNSMTAWFEKAWVPSWNDRNRNNFTGGLAREYWLKWNNSDRFDRWGVETGYLFSANRYEAFLSLPSQYQNRIWQSWTDLLPGPDGGSWSGVHEMVSSGLPREQVRRVLLAIQNGVSEERWLSVWLAEDEYGVSPKTIWDVAESEIETP